MIIVDSSVWINYFNGITNQQTNVLDKLLYHGEAHVLDIILAEVLQGFNRQKDFEIALTLLERLPCYQTTSKEAAIQSAKYYRQLRKKGITIRKTIDMFIATWCISNNALILQQDRDFDQIAQKLPLQLY